MSTPTESIRLLLRQILYERKDVTLLACQQRAKFEGWLKFELACALNRDINFEHVFLEDGYIGGGRSDISFNYQNAKWYLEMKTSNSNWRAEGLPNINRPITKNINAIAEDILVLRQKGASAHGIAAFCIFPIPFRLWQNTREQLDYHLRRIEGTGKLSDGLLIQNADYIEIANNYGICSFVVEIF